MPKSQFARDLDALQRRVRPFLYGLGFKAKGRSFNRVNDDGLTQVIEFFLDASRYSFGVADETSEVRPGCFKVHLGVYLPELAVLDGGEPKSWVQDRRCCIRSSLPGPDIFPKAFCWSAIPVGVMAGASQARLRRNGIPLLERFVSRDKILAEASMAGKSRQFFARPPGVVAAAILAKRGEIDAAAASLQQEYQLTDEARRESYGRVLLERAEKLGVRGFSLNSESSSS